MAEDRTSWSARPDPDSAEAGATPAAAVIVPRSQQLRTHRLRTHGLTSCFEYPETPLFEALPFPSRYPQRQLALCILVPDSGSVLRPVLTCPAHLAPESWLNPLLNFTFKQTSGLMQAAVHEQHTESLPLKH